MKGPSSCHACTALLVCLAHDRRDHKGQLHFDAASRLSVDLPRLRADWYLEDSAEAVQWARRGEGHLLQSLRGERSYSRGLFVPEEGETGGPRIVQLGEYVPELDGDPFDGW